MGIIQNAICKPSLQLDNFLHQFSVDALLTQVILCVYSNSTVALIWACTLHICQYHVVQKWSQYLWYCADSADFTDQFTVALKKEQELKVQFVQTLTQFQLLKRTKQRNIRRDTESETHDIFSYSRDRMEQIRDSVLGLHSLSWTGNVNTAYERTCFGLTASVSICCSVSMSEDKMKLREEKYKVLIKERAHSEIQPSSKDHLVISGSLVLD